MTFSNGLQPQEGDTDWILWAKITQMFYNQYGGLAQPLTFANGPQPQGDDTDHQFYAKSASLTYAAQA
jgi:hypothetical protein